jgi:putative FmdB family regulatory protein
MPIYEYECRACGHQFEFLLLPKTTARCPKCQGEDLERMLSSFVASSDSTREANLAAGHKEAAAIRFDKDVEHEKYRQRELADD